MYLFYRHFLRLSRHLLLGMLIITANMGAVLLASMSTAAAETDPHKAIILTEQTCASTDHYTIALLLSSLKKDKNQAYIAGATFTVNTVNAAGGIRTLPICLVAYDDHGEADQTVQVVKRALSDKRLIAMVGLSSSSNAEDVVAEIGASGVPLLSDISLDRLFASYKNIFTMSKAVSDDTRAFTHFVAENYSNVMFIGALAKKSSTAPPAPDLFAAEFMQALETLQNTSKTVALPPTEWIENLESAKLDEIVPQNYKQVTLTPSHWLEKFDQTELDAIVADIRKNKPDLLCLAVGSQRIPLLLNRLTEEKITLPVFLATGSIIKVTGQTKKTPYQGAFFQVGGNIPNLVSEKLAKLITRPDIKQLRIQLKNSFGDGVIYADLLAMIARTAKGEQIAEPVDLRRIIVKGLTQFREGQKIYPGVWRNWSFSDARASARNSFILWTPNLRENQRLWRIQNIRSANGLRKITVAYVSVDLVRIHSTDTNKHSFDAEFYLSLSSKPAVVLDKFAFSNAVKSGDDGQPLVYINEINPLNKADDGVKLYSVKGRFRFTPLLSRYPFDQQRFSVSFKPVDTANPFLIQPPDPQLLDRDAEMDGWVLAKGKAGQYVGAEQDIISTVVNHESDRQIQPYYRFNFTWVAQRETLDYYIRVVTPLALIMLVAYFSVFLPSTHVESVVSMQVTSLLATIALYFSIQKLDTETATLSDQIFVFAEAVIVILIMLSIFRVNLMKNQRLMKTVKGIQLLTFPLLVWLMFRYVKGVSAGDVKTFSQASVDQVICPLLPGFGSYSNICQFFGFN